MYQTNGLLEFLMLVVLAARKRGDTPGQVRQRRAGEGS